MHFGFGKVDITPRVGVGLYGYGPFLNRHSTAIREPLYARALAASDGDDTVIIASCDLVGVSADITAEVRQRVHQATGVAPESICVHCIHTHSGPRTKFGIGQGIADPPYMEILPVRITQACTEAANNLQPATLRHAVVPCEGIGYSREDDVRPSLEEALSDRWRPPKPERTDTRAHVLRVDADGHMTGFLSYFSCHPVVGPSVSRYIHSDFAGLATNWLEREHPGSTGLFLQGCEGNINSCVVHHPEQESLLALDAIAARYARQIRPGFGAARPLEGDGIRAIERTIKLSREPLPPAELRQMLAEREATIKAPGASDADIEVRRATVYAVALRRELLRQETGQPYDDAVRIQGFRIGGLTMLGAPFEMMIRYKQRVQSQLPGPTLVLSLCNDTMGYAPERACFDKETNYAAKMVPYLLGFPPFAPSIEDELVGALVQLGQDLLR